MTSGSALLNLHPAVAEAYYQQVPLLVISADRPAAWIGQMDGQTLPQPGVFGSLVKMSVNLPDIHTEEDEWYCNRLINEAILELDHHGRGPVHINVPVSEPIYRFTVKELPEVRVLTRYQGLNMYDRDYSQLIERLNQYSRRMVVVGQLNLIYLFSKEVTRHLYKHFVWLTEHLSNRTVPGKAIKNFDAALSAMSAEKQLEMAPELLITYGGHLVSKQLKKYLRNHPPKEHWHIAADGKVADVFGCLTTVIEMDPFEFLEKVAPLINAANSGYPTSWEAFCQAVPAPQFPYSEMSAIGSLLQSMPEEASLHLANSSAVRYAQLYPLKPQVEVCCNRGVNGIEGSLSSAVGYSVASRKINFVVIGDLSFFYDMNALWNHHYGVNLRILLLNNGGGEIFHTLPGMDQTDRSRAFITAPHTTSACGWAEERGFLYLKATNQKELDEKMQLFASMQETRKPMLLEVMTNADTDTSLLREYYRGLRHQ